MKKSQISNLKSQISTAISRGLLRPSTSSGSRNDKGFTLIELLVVIVIIGVLASFLMTNYVGVRMRARDTQRKSDLRQIQSALEIYRSDVGAYPDTAAFPACGSPLTSGAVIYMQKVPCDPTNAAPLTYIYQSLAPNLTYTLTVCLENGNDQQKDDPNDPGICDGISNWSYTLLSP